MKISFDAVVVAISSAALSFVISLSYLGVL